MEAHVSVRVNETGATRRHCRSWWSSVQCVQINRAYVDEKIMLSFSPVKMATSLITTLPYLQQAAFRDGVHTTAAPKEW